MLDPTNPQPQQQPPQVIYVAPPATNSLATGSMVTGIASIPLLFCCGLGLVTGIVAIALGFIALDKAKKTNGLGASYAWTGIATGGAAFVLMPVFYFLGLMSNTLNQVGG